MMSLSKPAARFSLLFGLALTIGTTNAIALGQAPSSQPVNAESCSVHLIDSVELASAVPGILESLPVEVGDRVSASQPIAILKAEVAEAQQRIAVKEAENDVEKRYARKAAELADTELQKALEANQRLRGTVPEVEVERLRLAAERAHLQIEQAEHQLEVNGLRAEEADANLHLYRVTSKIDGLVTETFKRPGEAVQQGESILKIESAARLHVRGYIAVANRSRVKQGDRVRVALNIPGIDLPKDQQVVEGVIKLVGLSVEPVGQRVPVVAEIQNPHNVFAAGLPVTMSIFPGTAKDVQTTRLDRP